MPIVYINRHEEKYYLKKALTKTGKIQHCAVKDIRKINPDDFVEEIPLGYEFYEEPQDARVYFRKIPVYNISDEEVEIIDSVMKKHETVSDYIIDKGVNDITVNIELIDKNDEDYFHGFLRTLKKYRRYESVLKFGKEGKKSIEYTVKRFCYRSSVDDWIVLERSNDLKYLAQKYCYHIDKESLYNFDRST